MNLSRRRGRPPCRGDKAHVIKFCPRLSASEEPRHLVRATAWGSAEQGMGQLPTAADAAEMMNEILEMRMHCARGHEWANIGVA